MESTKTKRKYHSVRNFQKCPQYYLKIVNCNPWSKIYYEKKYIITLKYNIY